MNVNKKLDRFKQWAGERMGGEVKTNVSDDFKAMEFEMGLRQEGLEKMQRSTNAYVKAISKRSEVEGKEKILPIAHMGGTMISHGEEFEPDSEYGSCLHMFGRTHERLARTQESYIVSATTTWLECLERSLVQLKEYQAARKRLEQRRLAYDTSLAKLQKAKREDFRVEEELRTQRAKYEESEDDVQRRMQEIRDTDPESVADIAAFLDAELSYHDKCREALLQLKGDWPARSAPSRSNRPNPRSRSNTVRSYTQNIEPIEEAAPIEIRPTIKSSRSVQNGVGPSEDYLPALPVRPNYGRATTFNDSTTRDLSLSSRPGVSRIPSDSLMIKTARSNLRNVDDQNVFADDSGSYTNGSDHGYDLQSISPATSHGSDVASLMGRKSAAPPPPPSRAKKPPPPPVPAKRSVLT